MPNSFVFFIDMLHFLFFSCWNLVQHFDQRRQYEKALSYIDQAIAHTPTVIDLYLVKVLILLCITLVVYKFIVQLPLVDVLIVNSCPSNLDKIWCCWLESCIQHSTRVVPLKLFSSHLLIPVVFYNSAIALSGSLLDNVVLEAITISALSQGRIKKHAGDPVAAAALADEARTMDLADRFLNSECVKRMLQADQVFVVDSDVFTCLFVIWFYSCCWKNWIFCGFGFPPWTASTTT